MEHPTTELVQSIKAGDKAALDMLLHRYMPRVLRIIRQRIGPKLRGKLQSGDIVQDVFLRVVRGINEFTPRSDATFANWISRLVTNELADKADYFSAKKRDAKVERPLDTASNESRNVLQIPAKGPSPSSIYRLKEEHLMLERCMDELKKREQDLIMMRDVAEMTFEEIGKELDLKTDAARIAYGRAKARLTNVVRSLKRNSLGNMG